MTPSPAASSRSVPSTRPRRPPTRPLTARPARSRPQAGAADAFGSRRGRHLAILGAAARFFAMEGYENADLSRLATGMGIGKGTLYRHFPTKAALFRACLKHGVDGLLEAMAGGTAQRPRAASTPAGRRALVGSLVATYADHLARHPHLGELIVLERTIAVQRRRPRCFVSRADADAPWSRCLALLRLGRRSAEERDALRWLLQSMMVGMILAGPDQGSAAQSGQAAALLVEAMLRRGRPGASRRRARAAATRP